MERFESGALGEELSVAAILDGIRNGRTVVKLQGPDDPMIELSSSVPPAGDTITAGAPLELVAKVSGGRGSEVRFIRDGSALESVVVDSDPFEHVISLEPPASGESRIRAEVMIDGKPRTVTSHLWLRAGNAVDAGAVGSAGAAPADGEAEGGGCGCRLVPRRNAGNTGMLALLLLAALAVRRR